MQEQTKICNKCGIEKRLSEFHIDKKKKYGRHDRCKPCRRADEQQRRINKKDYLIEFDRQRSKDFSDKVHEYMGSQCAICEENENFPPMYQCHHVDPRLKEKGISSLRHKDWETVVIPELNKCVYLCSNCHAKVHWGFFDKEIETGKIVLIAKGDIINDKEGDASRHQQISR